MIGRWVSPVGHDRTRPVVIFHEWKLTGNDRTLRSYIRSLRSSASGHNLNALMTVEIGRSAFEAGTRGTHRVTGRWGPASGRSDRHVRSPRFLVD